jgi:hypothetical protein
MASAAWCARVGARLTAGAQHYGPAGGGGRGPDAERMGQADAAALCAGMSDGEWALFRVVYCGDWGALAAARRAVLVRAALPAAGWPEQGRGSRRLEELAELAVADLCQGWAARQVAEQQLGAPHPEGGPLPRQASKADGARHCRMARKTWGERWDARYDEVHREAAHLLWEAEQKVGRWSEV